MYISLLTVNLNQIIDVNIKTLSEHIVCIKHLNMILKGLLYEVRFDISADVG